MNKVLAFLLVLATFLGQVFSVIDPGISNNREGIYNYCPSVFQTDDGTRYIYYCTNKNSYEVVDHIGFRKGVRGFGGRYKWSDEKIVLSPTQNSWDAHHTCDPSVIKGDFEYNGKKYEYLMAYLGCTSYDSQDNKIGLAVANRPDEEFVKIGSAPFVDYIHDYSISPDIFQWGVGQPSLVSMDKRSLVKMFYTCGDKFGTRMEYITFDASDLSNIEIKASGRVTNSGLVNLEGNADYLNNGDFALDRENNIFYAVSDCHPYPNEIPSGISDTFRVTSIGSDGVSSGEWKNISQVGKRQTHFDRNHDCGLLRDEYGSLPDGNRLSVYYTNARADAENWLWSFRIFERRIKLSK